MKGRCERRWTGLTLDVRGGRWSIAPQTVMLMRTRANSHCACTRGGTCAGETTGAYTDRPGDLKAVTCNICQCKRTTQG